jgi:hypothetical protein
MATNITDFKFVLDKMTAASFALPSYVAYDKKDQKTAGVEVGTEPTAPSYNSMEFPIDSQENVWLSAVKLACAAGLHKLAQESLQKKIYAAAERYGIEGDLQKAAEFIQRLNETPRQIKTASDWQKAKTWLIKYASQLAPTLLHKLADYLLKKTAEVGYIPSRSEKYELTEMAGRDPVTPEIEKWAEENIHKLASGNYYRTDQFAALPYEEVNELLPDLLKTASLGMPVLNPDTFAKAASEADESSANVIDWLLEKHGQLPIHTEKGLPIAVNDEILAEL